MNESTNKKVKIGILGHYGNQNLGDEAIIEAAIKNLRERIKQCVIVGLSINPFDTRDRYQIDAFPIRYREDFFSYGKDYIPPVAAPEAKSTATPVSDSQLDNQGKDTSTNIKTILKKIPVLGYLLKKVAQFVDVLRNIKRELTFLRQARKFVKDIDLLLITGSNQFLDNFGGAWGFPYTLLKWTLLAKSTNTKVAFISVGAGPLTLPLSFKMLNIALQKADYVSYRDEGSKALIEGKININASIYPDIAHSLGIKPTSKIIKENEPLTIAINPMPVYDSRYWHEPNEEKFQGYITKTTELCMVILTQGHTLNLFSTQSKDEDVIDDIIAKLGKHIEFVQWEASIRISKNKQVSELIQTIDNADLVVATRFHATVLPLQLNKPVLGICYYRKAAELLDDVGLNNYHVNINDFTSQELIEKFNDLVDKRQHITKNIESNFNKYKASLDEQYSKIVPLII
jgi:polysaccharide pyruvyl transferase WcaK-like protein